MPTPANYDVLTIPEIAELAECLENGLGRPLTLEERRFFLLAQQAYVADAKTDVSIAVKDQAA